MAFFEAFGGRKNFYVLLATCLVSGVFMVGFFRTAVDQELMFSVAAWLEFLKWALTGYLAANAVIAIPEALAGNGIHKVKFFDFFGGRKNFYVLFLTLLVTFMFLVSFFGWFGAVPKFPVAEWLGFLKWAIVNYLAANAVKAIPGALPDKIKKKLAKSEEAPEEKAE
jgi:hypothetical protein